MSGTAAAAELVDVSRSFRGVPAVQHVSTALPQDAITGLLGRNGAGKTTIMRLLTGHLRGRRGTGPAGRGGPVRERPGAVPHLLRPRGAEVPRQDDGRPGAARRGPDPACWDDAYARDLAADFGLPDRRAVSTLSRGMLSAVGVVGGLASRAPVTFFDEPYLGLDAVARQLFYDRLLADDAEHPRTVVLSTHLIDEVADLLEHVVVDGGRVLLDEAADDLRGRGAGLTGPDPVVTSLLAGRPVLGLEKLGATVRVGVDRALRAHDAAEADRLGPGVEPVSLQQLVVRTSTGSPRAGATGSSRTALAEGARRWPPSWTSPGCSRVPGAGSRSVGSS